MVHLPAIEPRLHSARGVKAERWVFAIALTLAMLLRGWDLGSPICWPDEAESSINALTILEHGHPTDRYLGLPIYENMLTRPWPEHPEYEFRDSSYSDRGFAVYHGWLPLYAIAASFWLAGVQPDHPGDRQRPRLDPADQRRRTAAARAPSLAFAALFLVCMFYLGRSVAGSEGAWAVFAISALSGSLVWIGRQARYYSAAVALTAATFLGIVLCVKRGLWRHYLGTAIALVLLFHTHVMTAVVAALLFCVTVPWQLRHARITAKLLVLAAVTIALTAPWLILTGVLDTLDHPRAWVLLQSPADTLSYIGERKEYVVALLPLGLLAAAKLSGDRLPSRLARPFVVHQATFLLAGVCMLAATAVFFGLMPAASLLRNRLSMMLHVPALLSIGLAIACLAQRLVTRCPAAFAFLVAACFALGAGRFRLDYSAKWSFAALQALAVWDELPTSAERRLYATPNDHLILTFYTGLPFQSIAPVRKEFLDEYPGDVILLETPGGSVEAGDPVDPERISPILRHIDPSLTASQRDAWAARMQTRVIREGVAANVARVVPALEDLPPPLVQAVEEQRRIDARRTDEALRGLRSSPLFRGFDLRRHSDVWQIFFYRFVDPRSRRGARLNYAERLRGATAFVSDIDRWTVFHLPARR